MSKVRGKRALLNLPGHQSTAAIIAEVEDTRDWKSGKDGDGDRFTAWDSPDYCLQISDCDRSIKLDLAWQTEDERENALYKIDTMIDALVAFRKGVAAEQKLHVKRLKAKGVEDDS